MSKKIEFIDLGLPSGRLRATENEKGYFTYDKAKEKFDPKTLHPFDKVLVRVDKNDCWMAAHFSHVDDYTRKAVCNTFRYTQCVPYNEETKHLVSKTDDCPEYYKWWED